MNPHGLWRTLRSWLPFASLVLAAAVPCMQSNAHAAPPGALIVIIAQTDDPVHQQALGAFAATLSAHPPAPRIETRAPQDADAATLATATLIVTFGSAGADAGLGTSTPVIHALLSRATLDALQRAPGHGPHTALILDQPPARQIALLRAALPEFDRLATLHSPDMDGAAAELGAAARAQGVAFHAIRIEEEHELYPGLRTALERPAVLVSLPDTHVFNRYTVQNVLMTAYRLHAPVLGHSAALVRAGATLGLYTTPVQAGQEAARLAARVLDGAPLPPTSTPQLFEVGVNATVARALGLNLPTAEALTRALIEAEEAAR